MPSPVPEAASDPQTLPTTRAIVQRRLVGLAVLLLLAFLISLMLRAGNEAATALPAVVIPLNSSTVVSNPAAAASTAPTLDSPAIAAATTEPSAAPVLPSTAAEPAEPRASRPFTVAKPAPSEARPKPAAKPAPEKPVIAKPTPPKPVAKVPASTRWFVAIGAYKDPMAAQAIANRVKFAGFAASSQPINSGGERLHRVRAGPFGTKAEAEGARVTLIVEGLTKAAIVSEK